MTQLDSTPGVSTIKTMSLMSGIQYHKAKPGDGREIVAFMKKHPEVAFCDWQNEIVTHRILTKKTTVAYIATKGKEYVGVAISGVMGSRGTINHLAVDPKYRINNIGNTLIQLCTDEMINYGIRRMFIFTDIHNHGGLSFWKKQGFSITKGEVTLEKNL